MGGGRRLVGLGALMVVLALSGCGSSSKSGCGNSCANAGSGGAVRTTNKGCAANCANAGLPGAPAPSSSGSGAVAELGCHQYCQSAGGYGGGGGPSPPPAAKILNQGTVSVLPGGVVPVTVQCAISSPCRGAILIDFGTACTSPGEGGRSDLDVSPQSTRTIGVPLSSCQLALVRRRGSVKVVITADTGASGVCKQYDCVVPAEVTLRSSA
ncbi:MAG TPA: hypothetical protein VMU90_09280 [Solirubrobacteraceae bacterium]|nr:hypothetical protein [Solirubrobacteraceae bacterium]